MKKYLRKPLSIMLASALLVPIAQPAASEAMAQEAEQGGQWNQVDEKWYYVNPDGSFAAGWNKINGNWYYLSEENNSYGEMYCNAVTPDQYYVGASGAQVTQEGWINAGYAWIYLQKDNKAATGWKQLNGNWYYFSENGQMFEASTSYDGYYLKADGAMAEEEGWYYGDGRWVYTNSAGQIQRGWKQSDGKWYYLDEKHPYGHMNTNCFSPDGYYLGADGAMITEEGWQNYGDLWTYVKSDGKAVHGWQTIGGKEYYFDEIGYMVKDQVTVDGYFVGSDGAMITEEGWHNVGTGKDFYVREDGTAAIGWQTIDGSDYYFNDGEYYHGRVFRSLEKDGRIIGPDGRVVTDEKWEYKDNGLFYHPAPEENAVGWYTIDGKEYYFDQSGMLCIDRTSDDGYLLDINGEAVSTTGWYTSVSENIYYVLEDGKAATGWNKINGNWYFFSSDGVMYADTTTPDSYFVGPDGAMAEEEGWKDVNNALWYYTLSNGKVVAGWQYIGGSWYYFEEKSVGGYGRMKAGTAVDGYILGRDGRMI